MLRLNFLAFIAALALASAAVAGTKLYSNGSWTLFSVTDFALNLRGKEVAFGKACVAETGGANGTLRIVVVLENYGIVQVVSPLWSFRKRQRDATLFSGGSGNKFRLWLENSDYDGDLIQHVVAPQYGGASAFNIMAMMGSDNISIHNEKGKRLAQFPFKGFDKVYERALACAGLK